MRKAAWAALACLAFLGAVSAVTLDKVTNDDVHFNYQSADPSGSDMQSFGVVIFKLKFSGEIKIQKGAEARFLGDFPKDEQNFMGPFTSGGLDVTLKCGPNDELSMTTKIPAGADTFPKDFMYPVAPQPEAVARTISTILGGIPPIFPEDAYAKDTLLFAVLRYCGSCSDYKSNYDEATGVYTDPFEKNNMYLNNECSITVGGGDGEYKVVDAATESAVKSNRVTSRHFEPECSVAAVQSVLPILRKAQADMATAENAQAFTIAHKTSKVVELMDGLRACKNVLDSMMRMGEVDTWVPYTRMCVANDWGSEEWRKDPCCNGEVAFNQCCAPRDVQAKLWAITDIYASGLCEADDADQCMLDNALLGWQILQRITEDPAEGCRAQREMTTSWKEIERLRSFWNTCNDILFQGKSKDGRSECTEDSQCYTKCSKKDSKCTQPWWDFEQPFVACAIDNMDQVLINYFRSQFDVTEAQGPAALSLAIFEHSAKPDCTGDTANQGACMIAATEAECTSGNVWNFAQHQTWVNTTADTPEKCAALGANYVYVARLIYEPNYGGGDYNNRATQPAGCINVGTECKDFGNDWSMNQGCNSWGGSVDPCECIQTSMEFVSPGDCVPGESQCDEFNGWSKVNAWQLRTSYRADSPVDMRCKLQEFWPRDHNATCDAACQCALYRDILARHNDWGTTDITGNTRGTYLRFKEYWGWMPVAGSNNGRWAYQKLASGNQAYCEWDKKCAHRPWDADVTEAQCLAAEGANFCAECDGPYCWELSQVSKCLVNNAENKPSCLAKGGSWRPPANEWESADWCWSCCRLDNVTETWTRDSCFSDTFCPHSQDSWTEPYSGKTYTWENHGFCEWRSFCYNTETEVSTNKTACDVRRAENIAADSANDWPKWYAADYESNGWQQTDMEERWGYTGKFGSWRTYWQDFTPTVGMCVEGIQWYEGYGEGKYTQVTCEADGVDRSWFTARRFEEGRWDTEATCTRGVCNSEPWDWELAKSGRCETDSRNSGMCSRECKVCEAHWESGIYEYNGEQLCHADWLKNETACLTEPDYLWNTLASICYSKNPTGPCTTHAQGKVYTCGDLDKTTCTTQGLKNRPWYNGSMSGLLKCHLNNYGRCPNEEVCETGGTCNDWTYELWEGMTKPKCRVPWVNGTEWGGPDWESCPYPQAEGVWDDACIWKELTAAECAAKHGTRVSRAETLAECTRWKGCFHTTNHYITAISEGPCKDDQKCSVEDYEWRDVLDWRSGVWTPSTMVPREWKLREMAPRNKWGVLLSWSSIELLVNDAVYAILGRAYVNEALCMTEPVLQVFEPLSCACGKDRTDAANAEYCAAVKEKVHVSKIAEATSWKNIATRQVIKSAVGTTVPDIAALLGSGNGNQDKVDTFVSMLSAASQRLCLPRDTTSNNDGDPNPPGNNEATRRADTHPMRRFSRRNLGGLQNKCEQYEVVPNADGETVGQLIGNGMSIKGLKGGSVRTCLKKDPNIPLCLSKFEITDVAKGGADDKPGVPLQATVTTEGDRLCITVTLLETGEMTLYPILRTEDMKPYVAFVGTVVKAVMKLSIESKELFTLDVMKAFKVSIAKVLQNKGLSALKSKDVVIVKVCDDAGCIEYTSARRALSGGIDVSFRVNAIDGVDVNALEDSMSASDFVSGFVSAMAEEGFVVEAEISGIESYTTTPGSSVPIHPENPINVGLIVGLVVGGVFLCLCFGAGIFFFLRQKAAASAAKASDAAMSSLQTSAEGTLQTSTEGAFPTAFPTAAEAVFPVASYVGVGDLGSDQSSAADAYQPVGPPAPFQPEPRPVGQA